ncbi:hypothetical protein LguiA_032577 [Lonicera macranthoides]
MQIEFKIMYVIKELHLIYLRSRPDHPSVSRAPGLELLSRYRETSALAEFSTNGLSVSGWSLLRRRYFIKFPVTNAVEADGIQIEISNDFVSVTHLLVGVAYCLISWAAGLPNVLPKRRNLADKRHASPPKAVTRFL